MYFGSSNIFSFRNSSPDQTGISERYNKNEFIVRALGIIMLIKAGVILAKLI